MARKKYSDVKSRYIRNLIKKTSWKDTEKVDDLIFIEQTVLEGVRGMGGSIKYHGLREKYPEEWRTIYNELDPKGYRELLKREKADSKQREEDFEDYQKKQKEEQRMTQEDWLKAGGKP